MAASCHTIGDTFHSSISIVDGKSGGFCPCTRAATGRSLLWLVTTRQRFFGLSWFFRRFGFRAAHVANNFGIRHQKSAKRKGSRAEDFQSAFSITGTEAIWKGPALCPFAGIWVSQSAATYDKGSSRWYVSLKLNQQPAEGQPRSEFSGSHPCPFETLREAFRALRAVAPGYAFAAVWQVIKAEDEYAGVPAHA